LRNFSIDCHRRARFFVICDNTFFVINAAIGAGQVTQASRLGRAGRGSAFRHAPGPPTGAYGLLAIRIEPVVVKTMVGIREHAAGAPVPKRTTRRGGAKQAIPIAGSNDRVMRPGSFSKMGRST
jgi:hypothetical protein